MIKRLQLIMKINPESRNSNVVFSFIYIYSATVIREIFALLRDNDLDSLARHQNATLKTLSTIFMMLQNMCLFVRVHTYACIHAYVCIRYIMLHCYLYRTQWNFLSHRRTNRHTITKATRAWEITQRAGLIEKSSFVFLLVFFEHKKNVYIKITNPVNLMLKKRKGNGDWDTERRIMLNSFVGAGLYIIYSIHTRGTRIKSIVHRMSSEYIYECIISAYLSYFMIYKLISFTLNILFLWYIRYNYTI